MWSAGWSWGRWPPLRTWRTLWPCTRWPESIPRAPPHSPRPPPSPAHTHTHAHNMKVCAFSRKRIQCVKQTSLSLSPPSYLVHIYHTVSSPSLHISPSIIPPSIRGPVRTRRESSCDCIRWFLNVAVSFSSYFQQVGPVRLLKTMWLMFWAETWGGWLCVFCRMINCCTKAANTQRSHTSNWTILHLLKDGC